MMVRLSPKAREDVDEILDYFLEETGRESLAKRFLECLGDTASMLAVQPLAGRRVRIGRAEDVRHFAVRRFDVYLVFYVPEADGIRILRVLHGARDLIRLLEDET